MYKEQKAKNSTNRSGHKRGISKHGAKLNKNTNNATLLRL
ncbi:hypothetical protein FM107_14790 [Sphingobacterium sp. JB170]|nr:hypothetical protein FM107_14790 [Sphingobacterium sp. JB170]